LRSAFTRGTQFMSVLGVAAGQSRSVGPRPLLLSDRLGDPYASLITTTLDGG
jgi:hypothetical protein